MLKFSKYLFAAIFLLVSCTETPEPEINTLKDGNYLILSEGLLGQNNSVLSLLNTKDTIINNNYYAQVNNEELGDNANDMVLVGDNIYLIVAHSNKIIKLNKKTGKKISENVLTKERFMKRIYFDDYLYISDLQNNTLLKVDTANLNIINEIKVGPGPDGISSYSDYVYVANSAVGQFKDNEAGARTVSKIDKSTDKEIMQINIGPNVTDIKIYRNVLIATYANFHWEGKKGGIVLYDLIMNKVIRQIETDVTSKTILYNAAIYFLNKNGLNKLDISNALKYDVENVVKNTSSNAWYSFNIIDDFYFILDAKNYQMAGELLIYDKQNKIANFTTGINPNTIIKIE